MANQKTVYSIGSLAVLVGRTPRAIQLRLQKGDIEPDSELLLPDGRRVALFDEKTLSMMKDKTPENCL
jgi:hypothetical protein